MEKEKRTQKTKTQNYTESRKTAYCVCQRYGSLPFSKIL